MLLSCSIVLKRRNSYWALAKELLKILSLVANDKLCQITPSVIETYIKGNVYYPGFKRNFWLEFSTPTPGSGHLPPPTTPDTRVPRPQFLHPSTNGSIQTVTLGRSTKIDCVVTNLNGYQVVDTVARPGRMECLLY